MDIYCNDGYEEDVQVAQAGGTPATKYLRIYQNDYTPILAETPGHFTECTTPGYAAVALSTGAWIDNTAGGHVVWNYPAQTFTFTGSALVYGYYVTDASATKVYWAGRFAAAPYSFPSGGGPLSGALELDGP